MIFFKKINASAMQFAILVSVIIAVLLGSFLTLTHTHQFFGIQSKQFLNSIEEVNNGIDYGLQSKHQFKDSITLESTNTNTILKQKYWGGFKMLESTSTAKSNSFKKMALVGSTISTPNISLYVSESKTPLVLVGKTKLEGTAYISDKGIKPGSIAGHYYHGNNLVDGTIKYSSGNLPKLDPDWKTHIKKLIDYIPFQNDDVIPIREENKNSFFKETQMVYEREAIELNEKFIGNILIKSEKEIRVSKYAKLTDVTIIAPKIIIEKGFKGSGSFIASEGILIEENVALSYPSAIVIQHNELENTPLSNKEPNIIISNHTKIQGLVVFLPSENNTIKTRVGTKVNMDIKPNAIIKGQVYCLGNTQLSGIVNGSVYTHRFVTKGFGSIYVNHIYNGKILANDLHIEFSGLPFANTNQGIVKWLY